MEKNKNISGAVSDIIKGGVIGIANIIPGVSGGTMALVLGIYERLIAAIHNISLQTLKNIARIFRFNREGLASFTDELKRIDAFFLIKITAGALIAIVALANIMTYLLTKWHDPTYGFFFGLVLLSSVAPYKMIGRKTLGCLISAVIAFTCVIGISNLVSGDTLVEKARVKHELQMKQQADGKTAPIETSAAVQATELVHVFLLGAISISAMILPGVSGSFLLLLLGGYFKILKAIAHRDLLLLSVFALGCLLGIVLFTRLLNFLLKKWHNQTMAFLLGLVLGSLWMIWPFKTTAAVGNETIYLSTKLPSGFGANELLTVISVAAGALIVAFMLWVESRQNRQSNSGT